jgi:hypothetical protein
LTPCCFGVPDDMRHISTCHLCWLIYDLSRFERSVESLWRRYRQAKSWLAHSPSAPVAAGCVVIILLIAISFRLKPPAIPSRHGELAPPTPTLPVHVAPKRVQEPSQDGALRMSRCVDCRQELRFKGGWGRNMLANSRRRAL